MGSLEQAVYAIIISFVIGVILCPIVIPMLRKLKFGQNVRDDGPETHLAKQGTPTMGGVAFLAAFVITSFFFLKGSMDGAAIMLPCVTAARRGGIVPLHSHDRLVFLFRKTAHAITLPPRFWLLLTPKVT